MIGFLRRRARLDGVADGRSGAVVMIQRFGGALNLNVHLHALVVQRILRHLGLPTEVPEARPARATPRPLETEDQSQGAPEFDAAC